MLEYSIILFLIIFIAVITNATQHQYSSPGLLSLPMSESSRSFVPSVNRPSSATSSYDGLQGVCIKSLSLRINHWLNLLWIYSYYQFTLIHFSPVIPRQNCKTKEYSPRNILQKTSSLNRIGQPTKRKRKLLKYQ